MFYKRGIYIKVGEKKGKKINKVIGLASLMVAVAGSSTVLAANKGNFTFKFTSGVIGSTEFDLEKKDTMCKSTADSYRYYEEYILSTKYTYGITLDGNGWFNPDYSGGAHLAACGVTIKGNGSLHQ